MLVFCKDLREFKSVQVILTVSGPAPWMMSLVFSTELSPLPSPLRGMLMDVVGVVVMCVCCGLS